MSNQTPPVWIGVNEASLLVGKSLSTIRRLLPEIEESAPESIRREPIEGKGGERVLLSRSYLVQRFGIKEPEPEPPGDEVGALIGEGESTPQGAGVAALVEILERQLTAKDRQIENLQRDAEAKTRQIEEVTDSLQKFAAINAGLQNKLLALTEKVAEPAAPAGVAPQERRESVLSSPVYFIAVAVAASLIVGLLLYLVLS